MPFYIDLNKEGKAFPTQKFVESYIESLLNLRELKSI